MTFVDDVRGGSGGWCCDLGRIVLVLVVVLVVLVLVVFAAAVL